MRSVRLPVQTVAVLLALGAPTTARAEEDVPSARPTAPDTRTGRPVLALQYGYQALLGRAEVGRSHGTVIGWGQTPGLVLGYPLRRDFTLEAWGSYASFAKDSDCPGDCKGSSLALGLGGALHLLDGVPLDPWFAAGVGYRQTKLETPAIGKITYSGVEALRLAIGVDYYFTPAIGLGPYFESMLGRYVTRSPGTINEGTGHASLTFGLRVVLSPF